MDTQQLLLSYQHLSTKLETIDDSLVLANQALLQGPSKEQRRTLDEAILELELRRNQTINRMMLLTKNAASLVPPTPEQVESIQSLAAEVDASMERQQNLQESLLLASQVLDILQKVA